MKKLLMISAMLLVGAFSVSAQTYCYKFLYYINADGVKKGSSSTKPYYRYITFSNNKNVCYESDKDGNARDTGVANKAVYVNTENGIRIYEQERVKAGFLTLGGEEIFRFSNDYTRMNYYTPNQVITQYDKSWWMVFERIAAAEEQSTPIQLY